MKALWKGGFIAAMEIESMFYRLILNAFEIMIYRLHYYDCSHNIAQ